MDHPAPGQFVCAGALTQDPRTQHPSCSSSACEKRPKPARFYTDKMERRQEKGGWKKLSGSLQTRHVSLSLPRKRALRGNRNTSARVRSGSGGRADGNGDTKRPRGAGEAWQGSPEKAGEARDEKCEQKWLAKAGLSPGSPQAPARRGVCEHAERSPGEGPAARSSCPRTTAPRSPALQPRGGNVTRATISISENIKPWNLWAVS